MQSGLALVARAVMGMSDAEKEGTANWLRGLDGDKGAPPAVRAFARAGLQLTVAGMVHAESRETPGHTERAARLEEVMRLFEQVKRDTRREG